MPLGRLNVRNEYALGDAVLYKAANKEDSKAILEGVAVSGLVGILRQLGDLVEFAAEVFSDLHEEVKATAARGHKLMTRVQCIEAELPQLEKAVMAERSHVHFAYTEGSDWHPNYQTKQNLLTHKNSPQFILESYEECRHPPRLFLLDKFDTAGSGACLKRYSDPSFFKMACTSSELMKPESAQRGSNAHKNKKKGRQQRSGEVQHVMSISQHHGRKWHGESAENDSPSGLLQGRSIERSLFVTRDKKTELSEYSHQQNEGTAKDCDQVTKPAPVSCSPHKMEQKNADLMNLDNIPESFPGETQFNGIAGKTDNYINALTTMESEVETDRECQTKWEVELKSNINDRGTASATSWKHSTSQSSDSSNGHPVSPCSMPSKEVYPDGSNSDTANSTFHTQPPHIGIPSPADSSCFRSSCHHGMSGDICLESCNSNPSSGSSISNPLGNQVAVDLCNPVGSSENFKVPCIESWKNGSLFGFEPSKPLHVNVSSAISKNSSSDGTNNVGDGSVGKVPIQRINANSICVKERDGLPGIAGPVNLHLLSPDRLVGRTGNTDQALHQIEDTESDYDHRNSNMLEKQNSQTFVPVESETSIGKLEDSHSCSIITRNLGCELAETGVPILVTETSVVSNSEFSSSGTNCSYPVDGFQSNESLSPDNATKPSTIINSNSTKLQEKFHCLEQKRRQTRTERKISYARTPKEQLGLESPEYPIPSNSCCSYHPSPPLELMKISFHHLNCFPHGHQCNGSVQDTMFPSFMLLPDHARMLQDAASGSDDDIFYRSSPDPSEDIHSLHSESNSEQWESGELGGSKHRRMYNRTSSTTSISSSFEHDEAHSKINPSHESGNLHSQDDTKSFDSDTSKDIQHSIVSAPSMSQQEGGIDFSTGAFQDPALQHLDDLPPPPPLPPLQWRMPKPNHNLFEDKEYTICKDGNQPNDLHVPASTTLPHKPPAPTQPCVEGPFSGKAKQDQKQRIGTREPKQPAKGKLQDGREDLLQQIRMKSLNLRRTVTRTPSFIPAPATNINVVAILEKANAIRQAFASSDDENWSDN